MNIVQITYVTCHLQVLWDNIKRQTRRKLDHNSQSGSGGDQQLTRVDEALLDIIGRETVNEKGLEEPDDSPVIQGQKLAVKHNRAHRILSIAGKTIYTVGF